MPFFSSLLVFKIFVANPRKSPPVLDILVRNKKKLIEFLMKFQKDKAEDDAFNEEKNTLLATLNQLPDETETTAATAPIAATTATATPAAATTSSTVSTTTAAGTAEESKE